MGKKTLSIGFDPGEVRDFLAESEPFCESNSILWRHSVAEAILDISNDKDIDIILTKPDFLAQFVEHLPSVDILPRNPSERAFVIDKQVSELIVRSEAMLNVCRSIDQVATTDSTVLIEGESGTGKEVLARTIHKKSLRSDKCFVKINCAALSETLIESELFGHVRGAFTGAIRDRKGRFAQASGGTILLDEIGSMPLGSQAKLLRVLQEKEFELVGSSSTVKADVRIIATDNSNLLNCVQEGTFRQDLYYRLSVFPIVVPALRDRKEEIGPLAKHFVRKHARLNPQVSDITPGALQAMRNYVWPGNVRQLENAIQHALILETTNAIQTLNLPAGVRAPYELEDQVCRQLSLREKLNLYEKELVEVALVQCNGRKKKAAQLLGVNPKNFGYLLNKHSLKRDES